jgi:integrase
VRRSKSHIKGGTFAQVIRAYLASAKFQALAHSTQEHYRYLLAVAEQPETLGLLPVDVIRPALVQAFLDGLTGRPGLQINARVALKAVEKWAIVRDMIPHSITLGCEVEGLDGGHEPWSDEQVLLAETHARLNLARLITLAANTGQRGSDLVRMRWTDLETYEGRPGINVTQQKTGLRIWIPFTQDLSRAISSWERRPTFLVLRDNGQPWNRNLLSTAWLRERDGNPKLSPLKGLVLHGLRATAVVRLRRAGATTAQISDMVGLSAPMVTRYSRLSVQRENALAAVIHLDRTKVEREKKDRTRNLG